MSILSSRRMSRITNKKKNTHTKLLCHIVSKNWNPKFSFILNWFKTMFETDMRTVTDCCEIYTYMFVHVRIHSGFEQWPKKILIFHLKRTWYLIHSYNSFHDKKKPLTFSGKNALSWDFSKLYWKLHYWRNLCQINFSKLLHQKHPV